MNARIGVLSIVAALAVACTTAIPEPDRPGPPVQGAAEPVAISQLPLPPTAPGRDPGACTHATGCIDPETSGIAEGPGYLWDSGHVVLPIRFAGAPAAPDPAHIYAGDQVIVVKTDGAIFPNGDAWKCITCGVSDTHGANKNPSAPAGVGHIAVDHPQAFRDGRRILLGTNVLDCGPHQIVDPSCTPADTALYPIEPYRDGASMRELRLHPDDAHLGFSEPIMANGVYEDQFAVFSRLQFDPSANLYRLSDVTYLIDDDPGAQQIGIDPVDATQLRLREPTAVIGEFRGFTNDGRGALGIGTIESGNFDLFTTDLSSATSRRWTRNPAYTDPADMSPADDWMVYMDGRVNNRMHYAGALPGVPPLTDLVAAGAVQFVYNNGNRRFFQPYIGRVDSGGNDGQQLNACDNPTPGSGSICDPLWNGRADPTWSPDGTSIVYWQAKVEPPACGDGQPTARECPASTEPRGRKTRLMLAELTSREPQHNPQPPIYREPMPWATPYAPGDPLPERSKLPAGDYLLKGRVSGEARVVVSQATSGNETSSIRVTYTGYSHDGLNTVDGTESVTSAPYTWHTDLQLSGQHTGSRKTSEPSGFVITPPLAPNTRATITGTLTTTLDGQTYGSPGSGQ